MEFLSEFNFFVILLLFLTFALVSYLFHFQVLKKNINKLPPAPGPWKLPLFGNLHQMAMGRGLIHHVLREMARKHGPHIMHLQVGQLPYIVVTSSRLAKEVYKTLDPVFNNRPQLVAFKVMFYDGKDIASSRYNDYWLQVRKMWSHNLVNAKTIRSMAPVMRDEGERLISLARKKVGESFNFTDAVSSFTMSVVCRVAFGRIFTDQNDFTKTLNDIADLLGGFDIADLFPSFKFLHFLSPKMPKMLKAHRKIDIFLDGIIDEHIRNSESKKHGGGGEGGQEEDFVDILLRLKDSGNLKIPITNDNIKGVIFDMFLGGVETSASAVVWAMSELMRNPRVMQKVQQEVREAFIGKELTDERCIFQLKYLNMVVKETLRLHPPAPLLLPRESIKDCVIDGFFIPSKTKLIVNAWAIARDPDLWSDPECFFPERFENNNIDVFGNNFELIPFGAGKRICPGVALGLADTKFPLALLLLHFDWTLPADLKPEDLDMTEIDGASARKKIDLCLIPTLHSTTADRF